jgi:hypothetical protein
MLVFRGLALNESRTGDLSSYPTKTTEQMNGFTDKEVIGGLIAVLVTSDAAFFGWVVASIGRLDRKIDALDAKLSAKIEEVDARLSARLEALTIAVSQLDGAMWGRTPPEPPRKAEN